MIRQAIRPALFLTNPANNNNQTYELYIVKILSDFTFFLPPEFSILSF